ncbi:MAG: hypothetical protein JWO70_2148 [Betaproteobacteria bacterium]|nr:hypothetical protein [Betaproteobacteria bacterium]
MPDLTLRQRIAVGLYRLNRYCAALLERARGRLDAHAEKQKNGWAASMEYKRRYTNPEDAKRSRRATDT